MIQVRIDKLAVGGYGLARHEGLVIFVPYTVPGDEVLVEITDKKKNHAFAEIKDFIKKSPDRIEPPCPYYQSCGGCNWQHISQEAQLNIKEDLVRENLKKFLGFDVTVNKIIPSPQPWRYRNRIQLSANENLLGFKKRKSHDVVDIKDCLIIEEPLSKALPDVRESLSKGQKRVELYLTEKNEVRWDQIDLLEDAIGFSQVNRFQNEELISAVLSLAHPAPKSILELYAGSGNFTWPLAKKFPATEITAVELNNKLVERAYLKKKDFPKVQFFMSDVETFLRRWPVDQHDFIYLDPPRQGSTPFTMQSIASAGVPHIVYLSCHPVSLARDLSVFMKAAEQAGKSYTITLVQPFEMFPHTDHVETLVEIKLDSSR
jgi:23S rRNA (uracil1939-C5)-methyltransferase